MTIDDCLPFGERLAKKETCVCVFYFGRNKKVGLRNDFVCCIIFVVVCHRAHTYEQNTKRDTKGRPDVSIFLSIPRAFSTIDIKENENLQA